MIVAWTLSNALLDAGRRCYHTEILNAQRGRHFTCRKSREQRQDMAASYYMYRESLRSNLIAYRKEVLS